MGPRSWTLWLLRRLLALMFSGSLCFSVSSLCPTVVPPPISTHPCFPSHPFSRLYHGNFLIMYDEGLAWAAEMGKQMFSLLLPRLGKKKNSHFSAITSWHLSVFWLVQHPQASCKSANPGHSSIFLEWCRWLQGLPPPPPHFLVLLRNELCIRWKNFLMTDTQPPKKYNHFEWKSF